jgi:hypothetical protein
MFPGCAHTGLQVFPFRPRFQDPGYADGGMMETPSFLEQFPDLLPAFQFLSGAESKLLQGIKVSQSLRLRTGMGA